MDFNNLIGAIQLAISAFQLKFDHFKKTANRNNNNELDNFYKLGEAIRVLESALSETVAFVGQNNTRVPNPRLAQLWSEASNIIRDIKDGGDLVHLTFEKHLYWQNPNFYKNKDVNVLEHISLENVLIQLRSLRNRYEILQKKISRSTFTH